MSNYKRLSVYEKRDKYQREIDNNCQYTNDGQVKLDANKKKKILTKDETKYRKGYVNGVNDLYNLNKGRVRFSMQFYMYKAHIEKEYKKTDKDLASKGWSYDMRQYALKVLYGYDIECIKKGQINESSVYHYIY